MIYKMIKKSGNLNVESDLSSNRCPDQTFRTIKHRQIRFN